MLVIVQHDKPERGDQAVGVVAGDDVHRLVLQRAIKQSQVHDPWRFRELQTIGADQALISVLALEKFVSHSQA